MKGPYVYMWFFLFLFLWWIYLFVQNQNFYIFFFRFLEGTLDRTMRPKCILTFVYEWMFIVYCQNCFFFIIYTGYLFFFCMPSFLLLNGFGCIIFFYDFMCFFFAKFVCGYFSFESIWLFADLITNEMCGRFLIEYWKLLKKNYLVEKIFEIFLLIAEFADFGKNLILSNYILIAN